MKVKANNNFRSDFGFCASRYAGIRGAMLPRVSRRDSQDLTGYGEKKTRITAYRTYRSKGINIHADRFRHSFCRKKRKPPDIRKNNPNHAA